MVLAAWAPAQAATSKTSASINQFQYRLVDLDLNDGITPYLTMTADVIRVMSSGGGQQRLLETYGTTAVETRFGSARSALSDGTLSAAASMHPPAHLDGFGDDYYGRSDRTVDFILSPNTQMILSGVGTMTSELAGEFETAYGSIYMRGALWHEYDGLMNTFEKSYSVRDGTATVNLNAMLTSDSQVRTGRLVMQASAALGGPVSSVPEPSSYAMLLAGAFVVGSVARRRAAAAPA